METLGYGLRTAPVCSRGRRYASTYQYNFQASFACFIDICTGTFFFGIDFELYTRPGCSSHVGSLFKLLMKSRKGSVRDVGYLMHSLQFKELNDSFLINSANEPASGTGPRSETDENRASRRHGPIRPGVSGCERSPFCDSALDSVRDQWARSVSGL